MIQLHTTNRTQSHSPEIRFSSYSDTAKRFRDVLKLLEEEITTQQLPTGGFLLGRSDRPTMENAAPVSCIFLSAVQAVTHREIRTGSVGEILERSRRFIIRERSSDGLWRFFGRDSVIDADIDDTFYCLAAMPAASRSTIKGALDRILEVSGSRGPLLPTWYRPGDNCVDHTVNANVLHCLGVLGYRDDRVTRMASELQKILLSGAFLEGSPYYPDPLCLVLSYARASKYYSELASAAARESIMGYLKERSFRFATQLQVSMALEISIRINAAHEVEGNLAETLLELLEKPLRCEASIWFRHRSVELYYGTPAASAVFALSAINCYLPHF